MFIESKEKITNMTILTKNTSNVVIEINGNLPRTRDTIKYREEARKQFKDTDSHLKLLEKNNK